MKILPSLTFLQQKQKSQMGLAHKSKKAKTDDTLVLEISGGDEMEELDQMYQSAVDLLSTDPPGALLLLRGCIHECDKMLRIRHGDIPNATDEERKLLAESVKKTPVLPSHFHVIYANSLFLSGEVDTGNSGDFFNATVERAEIGLEAFPENDELRLCLARALLNKATGYDEYAVRCEGILKEISRSGPTPLLFELLHYHTSFGEAVLTDDSKFSKWMERATEILNAVECNCENPYQVLLGLANCYASLGERACTRQDTDDFNEPLAIKYRKATIVNLEKCQDFVDESNELQNMVDLGEAYTNLAILIDDDDQENADALDLYSKAMKLFNRVAEVDPDMLPAEIVEFLNPWNEDLVSAVGQ